jgi:threonine/homoserine/homoserine lactone efflux protein
MDLIIIGFTSFIVALSGALVPGPLFSITVSESIRRGMMSGPLIIVGHGILELSLVGLLLAGLGPLLNNPTMRLVTSVTGGVILIYLGYRLLKDARTASLKTDSSASPKGLHPIIIGIVGSLSNPYWIIWWITIGLGYLVSAIKLGATGVVVFFTGHILADLAWYSAVSYTVARGKKLIGDQGYRFLLYACGTFLIFFGAWFVKGI